MFDGLDYSTRIEHGVLNILHGALIIAKDLRMNIGHASIASQYSLKNQTMTIKVRACQ